MASKRKMVFGYRMEFGDIIPSPNEAETVQYIYATYLTGASFQHLAKELDKRDVPYDAGKHWNVNMVARILEDAAISERRSIPRSYPRNSFKQCRSVESRNALFPLEPPHRLNFTGCAAAQSPTALREKSSRY